MEEVNILDQLAEAEQQGLSELAAVNDEAALQAWKSAHLGKSAAVMLAFSKLGGLPKEQRAAVGQRANAAKVALEAAFAERSEQIKQAALQQALVNERVDVSLPGRTPPHGRLHPATQTLRILYKVFGEMGFQVYRAPDVETDEYNFTLLNIPEHHPARDMWDTFHTTTPGILLRTHTSPGQIHVMRQMAPEPVRVILPGMVYRYEQLSSRTEIQFNQVELLAVEGSEVRKGDVLARVEGLAHSILAGERVAREHGAPSVVRRRGAPDPAPSRSMRTGPTRRRSRLPRARRCSGRRPRGCPARRSDDPGGRRGCPGARQRR